MVEQCTESPDITSEFVVKQAACALKAARDVVDQGAIDPQVRASLLVQIATQWRELLGRV